jgi:hypothetical protein
MLNNEKNKELDFLLDETLKAEPGFMLPAGFAENIAAKVSRRFAWDQYIKEFMIYLAALAGFVAVIAVMAFIWYSSDIEKWLNFLLSNISWVIGINIIVVFILFADRVLLRYFFYKNSSEMV